MIPKAAERFASENERRRVAAKGFAHQFAFQSPMKFATPFFYSRAKTPFECKRHANHT
jgi:hypothetical protein